MVVGVAREFVQQGAADGVIRCPRVLRSDPLVAPVRQPLPQQPVVFHVVHRFQQEEPDCRAAHPREQRRPTKEPPNGGQGDRLQCLQVAHFVRQDALREGPTLQPVVLDSPSTEPSAHDRPKPKRVHDLIPSCGRRVGGRADVPVVAPIVLNEEVRVERRQQQRFGHCLKRFVGAVPQFMGDVDSDGAEQHSGAEHQPEPLHRPHWRRRRLPEHEPHAEPHHGKGIEQQRVVHAAMHPAWGALRRAQARQKQLGHGYGNECQCGECERAETATIERRDGDQWESNSDDVDHGFHFYTERLFYNPSARGSASKAVSDLDGDSISGRGIQC